MADVEVLQNVTEVKKTRKVKKSTKRRESTEISDVQISEVDQNDTKGYVSSTMNGVCDQLTRSLPGINELVVIHDESDRWSRAMQVKVKTVKNRSEMKATAR